MGILNTAARARMCNGNGNPIKCAPLIYRCSARYADYRLVKMPRIRGDQLLHRAHKINVSAKSSETICKQ